MFHGVFRRRKCAAEKENGGVLVTIRNEEWRGFLPGRAGVSKEIRKRGRRREFLGGRKA
jgi:hypothetical protein